MEDRKEKKRTMWKKMLVKGEVLPVVGQRKPPAKSQGGKKNRSRQHSEEGKHEQFFIQEVKSGVEGKQAWSIKSKREKSNKRVTKGGGSNQGAREIQRGEGGKRKKSGQTLKQMDCP